MNDINDLARCEEKVRNLVGDIPFRPLAYYDPRLDCIRVIVRDCSVTESRIDEIFTVLEDNYHTINQEKYVGFTIKGVRYILRQLRLDEETHVDLTELLDEIVSKFPSDTVDLVVNTIARPILEKEHLDSVEVPKVA